MLKPERISRSTLALNDARRSPEMARVWDPLVRILHWSLVASFVVAWFTRHSSAEGHQLAGYFAAAIILLRLVWGWRGTPYARFSQFVRRPSTVARYLFAILRGRELRYIGHNPAGGVMAVALLAGLAGAVLTGWMMTTETYFGVEWVSRAHELVARGLLALVIIHITGVLLASYRHRENLIKAMIDGWKRDADVDDVA